MKNVSQKKKRDMGTILVHVEPPPTPLIEIKNSIKKDKYSVHIKFRRYLTSEKLEL